MRATVFLQWPRSYIFTGVVPRTDAGKILRSTLCDAYSVAPLCSSKCQSLAHTL